MHSSREGRSFLGLKAAPVPEDQLNPYRAPRTELTTFSVAQERPPASKLRRFGTLVVDGDNGWHDSISNTKVVRTKPSGSD